MNDTLLQRVDAQATAAKLERSSWESTWRDLADNFAPRSYRYLTTERNRLSRTNSNIINGTPLLSIRTLAAGMMGGITSPARPWFRLNSRLQNPSAEVLAYYETIENLVREYFAKSNIYNALHTLYRGISTFGTSALYLEADEEDGLRAYNFPIGQYSIATDERGRVNACYREFSMTVAQLVERFGEEACSDKVCEAYKNNRVHEWVEVKHCIVPNPDRQHGKVGSRNMPILSVWYESGCDKAKDEPLKTSGYKQFPVMAPRWDITGEDVYGQGPALDALGDARALQLTERRTAQAFEKIINPPMRGPASLKTQKTSLVPGFVTWYPDGAQGQKFEPILDLNPAILSVAEAAIQRREQRIDRYFFADLWLLLAQSDGPQMTAREIAERHEEKLQQLGPVVERLEDELYSPLIELAVNILLESKSLPPPPPELQKGGDYAIEYISIMAQAQKLLGTQSKERLVSYVAQLVQLNPATVDVVDMDKLTRAYADDLGVESSVLRDEEEIAALRDDRSKQQQQQAQMEQAVQATQGAKNLAQSDTSGENALTQILGGYGGGVTPPAGGQL